MKFDMLCDIVLEGKKADKFARMVIGNREPIFSLEDVLRDPNDPSKGTIVYLSHRDAKKNENMDPEWLARRALRRINWVAKSAIKKLGNREIDLGKLNKFIIDLLEKYQTKILGYEKPDKMKTAQEARVIGNLLLPPTKHRPHAKGVFVPVNDSKKDPQSDPEQIAKNFNSSSNEYIEELDPDLIDIIKDVIEGAPVNDLEDESGAVSISTILKDPRIKDIYDSSIVRKVIKNMIEMGALKKDVIGNVSIQDENENERDEMLMPDEWENEDSTYDTSSSRPNLDDDDEPFIDDEEGSARRLGYIDDDNDRDDYEPDNTYDDDEKWY